MKDISGIEIKRMDFVRDKHVKVFLVTKQDEKLMLWDFQAWLAGYYDAYIPLGDYDGGLEIIGNFENDPDLLPEECEGYNGEPNFVIVEHIWP